MSLTDQPTSRHDVSRFVQRARLDGGRSQVAFDLLLDTLARPGTIRSLARVDLPLGLPTPLVLPLALADVEVPVAVVTGDPDSPWPALVADATGAPLAALGAAAQVVLLDGFGPEHLLGLARGTDQDPDGGARVAMVCRSLYRLDDPVDGHSGVGSGAVQAEVVVELSGPGVDGTRRLGVDGLGVAFFEAIAEACSRFPTGIDCWFVTPAGDLASIPRSSRFEIHTPARTASGTPMVVAEEVD